MRVRARARDAAQSAVRGSCRRRGPPPPAVARASRRQAPHARGGSDGAYDRELGQETAPRARQRPGCRRRSAQAAWRVCSAAQGGEAEGDAEGEGELAVGEQGDHAGGEPEGRPARGLAPVVADEAVEEVGRGDHRQHPHQLRAEQRGERREEDAVGEGVVAAVPAAVPDREAGALEQLGAEDLGGEVADLRVPGEHRSGQRGAERDGREPIGSEGLGLDHGRNAEG